MNRILKIFLPIIICLSIAVPSYAETVKDNKNGTYEDESELLERGYTIELSSKEDTRALVEYYYEIYRIKDFEAKYFDRNAGDIHFLRIDNSTYGYDRDYYIRYILNHFGSIEGTTPEEKIRNACIMLNEWFTLDSTYGPTDIIKSIYDKKTTCWQISKIMALLLNESGITATPVVGYYDGYYHMWVKSEINGMIVYSDPSKYLSGDHNAWNISYEEYFRDYEERSDSYRE